VFTHSLILETLGFWRKEDKWISSSQLSLPSHFVKVGHSLPWRFSLLFISLACVFLLSHVFEVHSCCAIVLYGMGI
jgi:hypothetical protein